MAYFKKSFPKQFNSFWGQEVCFKTLLRFKKNKIIDFDLPIIVTNNEYRFIVKEQLDEIKFKFQKIIIEPSKKNTAAPILTVSILKEENKFILMVLQIM